eukprot:757218-Hanusia_phi.AAC.6
MSASTRCSFPSCYPRHLPRLVSTPCLIPEVDGVFLAGVSAVLVAVSVAEEAAEHAVLRMEDRQMLVDDRLQLVPSCSQRVSQLTQLEGVEVVGGGETSKPLLEEVQGADPVGGVQAEVSVQLGDSQLLLLGQRRPGTPKIPQLLQHPCTSHEQCVCTEPQVELPHPLLLRLQHPARSCQVLLSPPPSSPSSAPLPSSLRPSSSSSSSSSSRPHLGVATITRLPERLTASTAWTRPWTSRKSRMISSNHSTLIASSHCSLVLHRIAILGFFVLAASSSIRAREPKEASMMSETTASSASPSAVLRQNRGRPQGRNQSGESHREQGQPLTCTSVAAQAAAPPHLSVLL